MMAPGLAREDVRDVHLDRRNAHRLEGVMDRNRRGGEACAVDDDAGGLFRTGLLDTVDQLALVIGAMKLDREAMALAGLAAELLHILDGGAAIEFRLAAAEQVHVRAVENVDGLRHRQALTAAPTAKPRRHSKAL